MDPKKYFDTFLCAYLLLSVSSCRTLEEVAGVEYTVSVNKLHFLGSYTVPHNSLFRSTVVGGLSGIDYDAKRDVYYLISDDRSALSPARFYTATIQTTPRGIQGVQFVNVSTLRQPNGLAYPDAKRNPFLTPDPEALRYNPVKEQFIWSSEGERITNTNPAVLQNPAIISVTRTGEFVDSFPLPPQMRMQQTENGSRRNGTFEGLTFADGFRTLYVSMEEPVYEDGPRAVTDTPAWTRIVKYDVATHTPLAQYAYVTEPVAHPAVPGNAFAINGVSDILAVGGNQLLVTERSFSTGVKNCTIRLFLAGLDQAADIAPVSSLKGKPTLSPVAKKPLLNTDSLGIYVDNIEGATFGPVLSNGRRSLVLVADNNFSRLQQTQFLLFEVVP